MKYIATLLASLAAATTTATAATSSNAVNTRTPATVERDVEFDVSFRGIKQKLTPKEQDTFGACVLSSYSEVHKDDGMFLDTADFIEEHDEENPDVPPAASSRITQFLGSYLGYDADGTLPKQDDEEKKLGAWWTKRMNYATNGHCAWCPLDCDPSPFHDDDYFCYSRGTSQAQLMTLLEAPKHKKWAAELCSCLSQSKDEYLEMAEDCNINFSHIFDTSKYDDVDEDEDDVERNQIGSAKTGLDDEFAAAAVAAGLLRGKPKGN